MEENKIVSDLDYLNVLLALKEIPFSIGQIMLVDFLIGNNKNKTIKKFSLHFKDHFSSLSHLSKNKIKDIINNLEMNSLIKLEPLSQNKYLKVYNITSNGEKELKNPVLNDKKVNMSDITCETKITDLDRQIFAAFGDFLSRYNDEQKKAIISQSNNILCVAGAGSGKTTVLTTRIEYMIKYKSIDSPEILAITFTKKAKDEMKNRLEKLGVFGVRVETFNSFCEKILLKFNDKIYGDKKVRVLSYSDKIKVVKLGLLNQKLSFSQAISIYFSPMQRNGKTDDQLMGAFINDCFFIRDYFKFKSMDIIKELFTDVDSKYKETAKIIFNVCIFIEKFMEIKGFRDFADQVLDTLKFFKSNPEDISKFQHILIDEYQDINSSQIELIDMIYGKNLFAVGDPRQSIYGWRGSNINYILDFPKKYDDCEIINLKKNYRSSRKIVGLINESIRGMNFVDLEANFSQIGSTQLLNFDTEKQEFDFIIEEIERSAIDIENMNEIFVLARTNRVLSKFAKSLDKKKIKYVLKNDEVKKTTIISDDEIILSTVHGIKGLEAEVVFLIGASSNNFPCKASDHPIIDMIKIDEYDVEEEERRLFYVALSRAKKSLFITYSTKKHTYFISEKMVEIIEADSFQVSSDIASLGDVTCDLGVESSELDVASDTEIFAKNNSVDSNSDFVNNSEVKLENDLVDEFIDIRSQIRKLTKRETQIKEEIKDFMVERSVKKLLTDKMEFGYYTQNRISYPKGKLEDIVPEEMLSKVREIKEIRALNAKLVKK